MDFPKYHYRDKYPYESGQTPDHDHHRRHERRSDEYHHTSARMRAREARHNHQGAFDVPASQPEKADYVHSWLQRSRANRACSPEPVPGDGPRKISPRAHMVKQASQKKKKRARSTSPEPVHSRETHSPVALRFEKKPRHNTRLDKYDHKPEVDRSKRRDQTKEHRREDSHGSLEDVQRHTRSEHQYAQRLSEHAQQTDHVTARRQSSKAKDVETIVRRPDHRSRAAEPRRRSRKQQAEVKEMEELSAFFTRRADGERAEAEKIRYRPHREQRHDTATARHLASDVRQQRTHDSPSISLHPSRSIGSTRQPSPASLRPDTHVSSCGDDSGLVLPTRPSSRSTTFFTWSTSDRSPNARAPVSNDSISERPRRSHQSSTRKLILQERKIKGPHVVSEDLKIRPASRVKYRPRKLIVYKDAQVQTSFDPEMDQNRKHAKKPIPQYRDSAVMTADANSNLKQRVSMLAAESLPNFNKGTVNEQPSSNNTATAPIDAPPQPQLQPQPQAWVTYVAEDRLLSQPFVAARNLLAQRGWQTYREPSSKQAAGHYTKLVPPERVQAVIPSHQLTSLRPTADQTSRPPSCPPTQPLYVHTQRSPRESMEDYINRIEEEALQSSTNNEEMDGLQPRGPDLTEGVGRQQLGLDLSPEGNNIFLPDTAWYNQHPLPTNTAHIQVQDPEYFDLEHYGQGIGGQDTRLPRLWEDPSEF